MNGVIKRPKILMSFRRQCVLAFALSIATPAMAHQQPQASGPSADRAVGKVTTISGNTLTVTPDSGPDVKVQLGASTRLLKLAFGQKDLKDAVPIQPQEIQTGDRILVRGRPSPEGILEAITAVVMKASDVTAKQEKDREEWKQHGIGGLVSSVDVPNNAINISLMGFSGNTKVKVLVAKDTVLRRYSPDSIKFDDAKPAALSDIKAGDQLRARGTRSADGAELTAQEIVSGTFRNIAGTVVSTDAAKNTLTVLDLSTKKPTVIVINQDSQIRKLPPMVAQRIAIRLKGGTEGAQSGAQSSAGGAAAPSAGQPGRPGGGDFQQLLNRMPSAGLTDLQKGDAVMLVSTEGSDVNLPKAVTILAGVEPILTADSGRAAMLLSPWNIGGGGGGDSGGGANP